MQYCTCRGSIGRFSSVFLQWITRRACTWETARESVCLYEHTDSSNEFLQTRTLSALRLCGPVSSRIVLIRLIARILRMQHDGKGPSDSSYRRRWMKNSDGDPTSGKNALSRTARARIANLARKIRAIGMHCRRSCCNGCNVQRRARAANTAVFRARYTV